MPTTLDDVSKLARSMLEAEAEVEATEAVLKQKKEQARLLREETIPGVMHELGLQSFKLDSGETLSVKREIYCSLPKEDDAKQRAFEYLVELNGASLIKTMVIIEFGKEEWAKAIKLKEQLEKKGMTPIVEQTVHPSTLKAFLKELIENSTPVTLETFGARAVDTTKVK